MPRLAVQLVLHDVNQFFWCLHVCVCFVWCGRSCLFGGYVYIYICNIIYVVYICIYIYIVRMILYTT